MVEPAGQGGEPAALARPALASRPGVPRVGVPFSSHLPELMLRLGEARAASQELDKVQVLRFWRGWADWIENRNRQQPLAVAIAVDRVRLDAKTNDQLDTLRKNGAVVVEVVAPGSKGLPEVPWPRVELAALPGANELDLRAVLVLDLAEVAARPDLANALRRDCACALMDAAILASAPTDLFDALPAVTLIIEPGSAPPRSSDPRRHRVSLGADTEMPLGALLDLALPKAVRGSARALAMLEDLLALAEAQLEANTLASQPVTPDSNGSSSPQNLAARLARLSAAKVDLSGAVKTCLGASRTARQDFDVGKVTEYTDRGQFREFVDRFRMGSQWPLSALTVEERKPTWWEGSWLKWLSGFFNRKVRYRLAASDDAGQNIAGLIEPYRLQTLFWIGRFLQTITTNLQESVEAIENGYGDLAEATRVRWPIRLSRRTICGEGNDRTDGEQAAAIRHSVQEAFAAFAAKEQASFFVDVERKGVVGQLGEARSGVFGIFFLLLFFARPFQTLARGASPDPASQIETAWLHIAQFVQDAVPFLTIGMAVGTVIAFIVNITMRENKLRLALVERFDARIDEVRNRASELAERTVREVLARFEHETEDYGATAEANLARMIGEVQAQQEEDRGGAVAGKSGSSAPRTLGAPALRTGLGIGRISLLDECRKLELKMRESFLAELCRRAEA